MFYLLNPSSIEGWWPLVAPLLSKVWVKTSTGVHDDMEDLVKDLAVGISYCILDEDQSFAGVFTVESGRKSKCLLMYLGGGEEPKGGWKEVDGFLEQMAEMFGCSHIQIQGRLGWKRPLSDLGYQLEHITMMKEAAHVRQEVE